MSITYEEIIALNMPLGDHGAIAAALSVGRTKVASRLISERGILAEFGDPVAADAMLTKLETFAASAHPLASVVKRALKFLAMPDGIDIGLPTTRALLDQLALAGVITTAEAETVKGLAVVPDPVSTQDVTKALEGR